MNSPAGDKSTICLPITAYPVMAHLDLAESLLAKNVANDNNASANIPNNVGGKWDGGSWS